MYLTRVGWVAVDAAPDSAIRTEHLPPAADAGTTPAPRATPSDQDASDVDGAAPGGRSGSQQSGVLLPVMAGGVLVALIVLALAALAVVRTRRRARWRRAGAPGAWALVLDALTLSGRPAEVGAVPEDVARSVGAGLSGSDGDAATGASDAARQAALTLAAQAQSAAFGPGASSAEAPGTGAPGSGATRAGAPGTVASDSSDADAPWTTATMIERALRRSASPWRRLTWPFAPLR